MLQATWADELRTVTGSWREQGLSIALVPTMGNLHDGHLALVQRARALCDRVVVSIFVNPTQFGPDEDFDAYPRTLEQDLEQLREAGAHLAFTPANSVMYPHGLDSAIRLTAPPDLAGILEGEQRDGHFDGVVTVVARLFNLVCPDQAVFGEKDYQQLLIIRRMTEDLGYNIGIEAVETVREADGLAMSSRNGYLGEVERDRARLLADALDRAAAQVRPGESDFSNLEGKVSNQLEKLGFDVDYVAVRSAANLGLPGPEDSELRILVAAYNGETRLIDNKSIK